MSQHRAKTVAEANAQQFTMPDFKNWRQFAGLIDGYSISAELGLDFGSWSLAQREEWESTGVWHLDVLHLRLMLFHAFRSDYMSGYTYTEHDAMADSLLQAISQQLNLPYEGKSNDSEKQA